ncbi:MAG: hypothetical protein ABI742_04570 [Gemmatimonadota bacterium]
MRVLLDEQVPIGLAALLPGHTVDTVAGMGWVGVKNGELLRRISGQFDAFLTMDRNLEFQQNLPRMPFGIILVRAPSNRLADIVPLTPDILSALLSVRPGQVTRVGV